MSSEEKDSVLKVDPVFSPWDQEDCSIFLRTLERNAFASVAAALRAQGPENVFSLSILHSLKKAFSISDELFRAELRRVTNDQKLAHICATLNPSYDTFTGWASTSQEGRDDVETIPVCRDTSTRTWMDRMRSVAQQHNDEVEESMGSGIRLLNIPAKPFVPERLRMILRESEHVPEERVLPRNEKESTAAVSLSTPAATSRVRPAATDSSAPPTKKRRGRQPKAVVQPPPPRLVRETSKDKEQDSAVGAVMSPKHDAKESQPSSSTACETPEIKERIQNILKGNVIADDEIPQPVEGATVKKRRPRTKPSAPAEDPNANSCARTRPFVFPKKTDANGKRLQRPSMDQPQPSRSSPNPSNSTSLGTVPSGVQGVAQGQLPPRSLPHYSLPLGAPKDDSMQRLANGLMHSPLYSAVASTSGLGHTGPAFVTPKTVPTTIVKRGGAVVSMARNSPASRYVVSSAIGNYVPPSPIPGGPGTHSSGPSHSPSSSTPQRPSQAAEQRRAGQGVLATPNGHPPVAHLHDEHDYGVSPSSSGAPFPVSKDVFRPQPRHGSTSTPLAKQRMAAFKNAVIPGSVQHGAQQWVPTPQPHVLPPQQAASPKENPPVSPVAATTRITSPSGKIRGAGGRVSANQESATEEAIINKVNAIRRDTLERERENGKKNCQAKEGPDPKIKDGGDRKEMDRNGQLKDDGQVASGSGTIISSDSSFVHESSNLGGDGTIASVAPSMSSPSHSITPSCAPLAFGDAINRPCTPTSSSAHEAALAALATYKQDQILTIDQITSFLSGFNPPLRPNDDILSSLPQMGVGSFLSQINRGPSPRSRQFLLQPQQPTASIPFQGYMVANGNGHMNGGPFVSQAGNAVGAEVTVNEEAAPSVSTQDAVANPPASPQPPTSNSVDILHQSCMEIN